MSSRSLQRPVWSERGLGGEVGVRVAGVIGHVGAGILEPAVDSEQTGQCGVEAESRIGARIAALLSKVTRPPE